MLKSSSYLWPYQIACMSNILFMEVIPVFHINQNCFVVLYRYIFSHFVQTVQLNFLSPKHSAEHLLHYLWFICCISQVWNDLYDCIIVNNCLVKDALKIILNAIRIN